MNDRKSTPPPLDRQLLMIAGVVVLGAIMTILDTTIVGVAITTLARDLDAPLPTIQWVSTAYMLAFATVIPLTGWASDRYGAKRLWMASLALFVAGSVLCGVARSDVMLIAFRVLQGLGGGAILPVGMTMLAQAAGPRRIGRVMAIVSVPLLLGPIFGPMVGGVLVTDLSWRWIFYVNLPIGLFALVMSYRLLDRGVPRPGERLDVVGLLLLAPGLVAFVYGLSEVASSGGVESAGVLVPAVGGLILLASFVVWALRTDRPLLDVRLFRGPVFSGAVLVSVLAGAALIGSALIIPLYYQVVRHQSALAAGLLLIPQGAGAAVVQPITGRLVDRGRGGWVVLAGLPLMALGFAGFTQVTAHTDETLLAASLFVNGLGAGCSMGVVISAALRTVARPSIPAASAALNIVARIGGALGTALFAVVLQHEFARSLPGAGQGIAAFASAPAAERAGAVPALAAAFGRTFWWPLATAVIGTLAAPLLLLERASPVSSPSAEDAHGTLPDGSRRPEGTS